MDLRTLVALKRINIHIKIKKYLTAASYIFILAGIFIYIFYGLSKKNQSYKLVSDYQKNPEKFQVEKIMTNPRIKFQYNDNQIYEIKAQRAMHKNDEEVTLYNVSAAGEMGNITSGELQINEKGDRLIFTQNPVLILNKGEFYEQ